jgi:hypothetical protein
MAQITIRSETAYENIRLGPDPLTIIADKIQIIKVIVKVTGSRQLFASKGKLFSNLVVAMVEHKMFDLDDIIVEYHEGQLEAIGYTLDDFLVKYGMRDELKLIYDFAEILA